MPTPIIAETVSLSGEVLFLFLVLAAAFFAAAAAFVAGGWWCAYRAGLTGSTKATVVAGACAVIETSFALQSLFTRSPVTFALWVGCAATGLVFHRAGVHRRPGGSGES